MTTSVVNKRKPKTLGENILIAFNTIGFILVMWGIVSFIDVIIHNRVAGGTENMLDWNFFIIFFNGEVKVKTLYIFILTILILSQLFLRDGQAKRIFAMLLGGVCSITMFIAGNMFAWMMLAAFIMMVFREINIYKRKQARRNSAAS